MSRSPKRGKAAGASGAPALAGVRVLVGRARHQAGALSASLRRHGASVVEVPFIQIRRPRSWAPLDRALRDLAAYDWLILTSVNGVEALRARLRHLHIAPRSLRHLRIAAIGPATRKAIEKLGLKVDVVPAEYVAESVVASLRQRVKGKRVLLARARVARDVIPRELRRLGARLDVAEAYETVVPQASRRRLRRLLGEPRRVQVITFTSSSTARNFAALAGKRALAAAGLSRNPRAGQERPRLASIGPVTSSTLRELGLPVDLQAADYTIPGLVKAIVNSSRG